MLYLFLANGFEEIEAITTLDLLRRAELPVTTVGIGSRTVTGSHGISVLADAQEAEAVTEDLTGVILPGGMPGTLNLERSPTVQRFLDAAAQKGSLIAAICAAPSILGHRGLLSGRVACCFPGFEEQLEGAVISGEPVCVDGQFITSRGAGTAVDFGLEIVRYFCGSQRASLLRASIQCVK